MKTTFARTALIIAAGLVMSAPSFAELSRAQVQAELAAAVRSGDIMSSEGSTKMNELYPNRYPAKQVQSTLTRAEVQAELAAAVRSGDIMSSERSTKMNEMYPNRYPAAPVQATLTRAQVQAELDEALRTGDYLVGGEVIMLCKDMHPTMHPLS